MIRALLLALTLCNAPVQAREVQGGGMIDSEGQLAPDAVLVVAVHGRDGVVAEGIFPAEGRQAPLPFRLEGIPDHAVLIQLAIREGDMVNWLSEPLEIGPGDAPVDLRIVPMQPYAGGEGASTMICGSRFVQIGFAGDGAVLSMGGESRRIGPMTTASGTKFADGAAAETSVWSKGRTSMVVWSGVALPECQMISMPEQASVTARGNEPGWRLDLSQDGLRLTTEGGLTMMAGGLPPPILRADAATYVVPGQIVATLLPILCTDSMSGMPYPLTAAVDVLDPPTPGLIGCAGDPLDLLQGEWSVVAAGNTDLPQGTVVTLGIDGDRIAGQSGCNLYSGRMTLTGENLGPGPLEVTRKSCEPDVMKTESAFLAALSSVDRFELREDGLLFLISADRPAIVARR